LHAHSLGLAHPDSGEPMTWKSALPEDMAALIAAVRAQARAEGEEGGDRGGDFADGPIIPVRGGDGEKDGGDPG
jgi:hypothetical protein